MNEVRTFWVIPEHLPVPDPYYIWFAGEDLGYPEWADCSQLVREYPKVRTASKTHNSRLAGGNQFEYYWGSIILSLLFPFAEIIYVGHDKEPARDFLVVYDGELLIVEVKVFLAGISKYGHLEDGYVPARGLLRLDVDAKVTEPDWPEDERPRYHLIISGSATHPSRYDDIRFDVPERFWLSDLEELDYYHQKLDDVEKRASGSGSGIHPPQKRLAVERFHNAVQEGRMRVRQEMVAELGREPEPTQLSLV